MKSLYELESELGHIQLIMDAYENYLFLLSRKPDYCDVSFRYWEASCFDAHRHLRLLRENQAVKWNQVKASVRKLRELLIQSFKDNPDDWMKEREISNPVAPWPKWKFIRNRISIFSGKHGAYEFTDEAPRGTRSPADSFDL